MSAADRLMRKASARFARGAAQEAHDLYGEAASRYGERPDGVEALRVALARYTRAMLVLKAGAAGDAAADVARGEAVLAGRDDSEALRFRGLFALQRALIAARRDPADATEATRALAEARPLLEAHGRPFDLVELERERALVLAAAGDQSEARRAAERAVELAGSDVALVAHARRTLAEVHEAAGRISEAIDALSSAYQIAEGSRFQSLRRELDELIRALRAREGSAG